MVRASLKEAPALQRRQFIPDSDRTPARDQCAGWVEREIVDGDRDWQETTITEMAESTGFSREHVATTLDLYFEPAGATPSREPWSELALAHVDADASGEAFQEGFRQGFLSGLKFARENRTVLDNVIGEQ